MTTATNVNNETDAWSPNLDEVLGNELPPEPDQIVVYTVEKGGLDDGTLHNGCCDWRVDADNLNLLVVKTTGQLLQQSFKENQVRNACPDWYQGHWYQATLLLRRHDKHELHNGFNTGDIKLLLYYEAKKPGNVDAWCNWFCGLGPEELREQGRQALAWNLGQEEEQVACFGVVLVFDFSWVLGCGTHAANDSGNGDMLVVHGLVPKQIAVTHGLHEDVYAVPVGARFTEAMFGVAANLYETWRDTGTSLDDQETARRAIEAAELALE